MATVGPVVSPGTGITTWNCCTSWRPAGSWTWSVTGKPPVPEGVQVTRPLPSTDMPLGPSTDQVRGSPSGSSAVAAYDQAPPEATVPGVEVILGGSLRA